MKKGGDRDPKKGSTRQKRVDRVMKIWTGQREKDREGKKGIQNQRGGGKKRRRKK